MGPVSKVVRTPSGGSGVYIGGSGGHNFGWGQGPHLLYVTNGPCFQKFAASGKIH